MLAVTHPFLALPIETSDSSSLFCRNPEVIYLKNQKLSSKNKCGWTTAQLENWKWDLCASTILRINLAAGPTVGQPVSCWKTVNLKHTYQAIEDDLTRNSTKCTMTVGARGTIGRVSPATGLDQIAGWDGWLWRNWLPLYTLATAMSLSSFCLQLYF